MTVRIVKEQSRSTTSGNRRRVALRLGKGEAILGMAHIGQGLSSFSWYLVKIKSDFIWLVEWSKWLFFPYQLCLHVVSWEAEQVPVLMSSNLAALRVRELRADEKNILCWFLKWLHWSLTSTRLWPRCQRCTFTHWISSFPSSGIDMLVLDAALDAHTNRA